MSETVLILEILLKRDEDQGLSITALSLLALVRPSDELNTGTHQLQVFEAGSVSGPGPVSGSVSGFVSGSVSGKIHGKLIPGARMHVTFALGAQAPDKALRPRTVLKVPEGE